MTEEGPTQAYLRFLEEGRFMLQRARAGGEAFFYPRLAAPGSGDEDWEWIEAVGEGVVYATTIMRPKPPAQPYNVALIDLAEGPRMMSWVEGVAPEDVRIGMKVRAAVAREADKPIVIFRPAE